ncbi:MAG: hypothetical protein WA609_05445 [Terriglobales bacterium]
MKTLKTTLALLLFALATLAALPVQVRADGGTYPTCTGQVCVPPGSN